MNGFTRTIIKIFLSLILMFVGRLYAQSNSSSNFNPYTHLPSIGTPSPTAAALGAYADYPVSNFTGVPEINIPLYEINEDGFKLPVSLSYNASGVKVDDVASWVGLGWSLNSGGIITRNVVGGADDVNGGWDAANSLGSQYGQTGFLYCNYNSTVSQASQSSGTYGNPVFNPQGTNPIDLKHLNLQFRRINIYIVRIVQLSISQT